MKKLSLLVFLLFSFVAATVAQRAVSGTVSDVDGQPLIGASVLAQGTTVGTVTDLDGSFVLEVPDGTSALEVSYTGFETQIIDITNTSTITVNLSEGTLLDEVVVVGYGERSTRNNVQSVSTVSTDQIKNIQSISPQQALQGQVSGVQMTNSSGVLGAASSIRIRGVSSITGGTQPLYVVDGVPLNTDDYTNRQGGASALNPLLDLNADDIESYSVLKDASAVAIYGSRGANGVILINTKKGKAGTDKVSASVSTGWVDPTKTYEMTNSDQYAELRKTDPAATFFDWPNKVLQTGRLYDANLNFSGGNDRTQYYLGGGYVNQSNYAIGNDLARLSGKLNFNHTLTDKLRFGANIGLSKTIMDRVGVENNTFAPLTSAYLQVPSVSAYNEDGSFANTGFIANVIAIEEVGTSEYTQRRTFGNIYLKYDLLEDLTFKTSFGLDNVQGEQERRDVEAYEPGGYGYKNIVQDNKWVTSNTLNYNKGFGRSDLNLLLGQAFETSSYDEIEVEATGFAADKLRNVTSGSTPTTTSSLRSKWALASFFGSANYVLDGRYLLEGSFRRDGSSRFGDNNKWGNFWSIGAGWIASEEDFLKDNSVVNFLKFKASYGTTGNDQIDNFASRGLYQGGKESDYNGNAGIRPTQPSNPDLKWEETAQFDIGFESILFNSVDFKLAYYSKNTTDLLLPFQLADASGFSEITRNAGEMSNSGVDIDLGLTPVENDNFKWSINLNASYLKNKILSLPDAAKDAEDRRFIAGSSAQRAIEGLSLNEFYLVQYKGVNPETGDAEWYTKDGEVTTSPTSGDRVLSGSALPSWTGGINTRVEFGDFDLSALFSYVVGSKVYLGELRFTENMRSGFNKSTALLDYWKNAGDNSFAPSLNSSTYNTFSQRSTLQLFDGDFGRLKSVELGYNLKGSRIGIDGLRSARIYVKGNNLLTLVSSDFRGQDPEVSANGSDPLTQGESFFAMPQGKLFMVGLKVNL